MSIPGLAPRGGFGDNCRGAAAAAVITIVIGFAAPRRAAWMPVGLGWCRCIVLAFVVQLGLRYRRRIPPPRLAPRHWA
ncbi:hypothetical protein [Microbacterium paulum]